MAVSLRTARGTYRLKTAAPPHHEPGALVLTLVLDHAEGIERVTLRCRIAEPLLAPGQPTSIDAILERLAPWLEREFEQTRELALKTIRSERCLLEIAFDPARPGPW